MPASGAKNNTKGVRTLATPKPQTVGWGDDKPTGLAAQETQVKNLPRGKVAYENGVNGAWLAHRETPSPGWLRVSLSPRRFFAFLGLS